MSELPSSMFNMFLDVCKNLINYIRKLWISGGVGTDIKKNRGIRILIQFVLEKRQRNLSVNTIILEFYLISEHNTTQVSKVGK